MQINLELENKEKDKKQDNLPSLECEQLSKTFKVYKYRFIIALIFLLTNVVSSLQVSFLVPIAKIVADAYQVSPTVVNFCTTANLILTPVVVIIANWALDNKGLAFGMRIGSILLIAGIGMCLLINYGFYFSVIGFILNGFAGPFLQNGITKIGLDWFSTHHRQPVTMILTISLTLIGNAGIIIPGVMFDKSEEFFKDNEQVKALVFNCFLILAIIASIIMVPSIILIKSKPPTHPSAIAEHKREPLFQGTKQLIKNINQIVITIAFCLIFGTIQGFSPLLSQMVLPFGFNTKQLGIIMVIMLIGGIIGGALVS